MLDYGYRSKCCKAYLRMGTRKIKGTNLTHQVWVCLKCGKSNVDIIPKSELDSQAKNLSQEDA